MKYGRGDDSGTNSLTLTTDYLIEVARGRSVTTYTDLSTELVSELDTRASNTTWIVIRPRWGRCSAK